MEVKGDDDPPGARIAVILPCFNKSASIAQTIGSFRKALPHAEIVVCDNASTDDTASKARSAGARVLIERRRGKGWAMRRLFADVEADIYVMADGDATYSGDDAAAMIRTLIEGGHDMVVGHRLNLSDGGTSGRGMSWATGHSPCWRR